MLIKAGPMDHPTKGELEKDLLSRKCHEMK